MREQSSKEGARRGAARAARERETLREQRYAQRLRREAQKKGRVPDGLRPATTVSIPQYEVEVVPGLEEFARAELRASLGPAASIRNGPTAGTLGVRHRGDARRLLALGTVTAIYQAQRFEVPRLRALLGEEQLQALVKQLQWVQDLHPPGSFRSFRFSAAGTDSGVFRRLAESLQQRLGLRYDPEEGELLLRIRRPSAPGPEKRGAAPVEAFEVVVRLSPRPLSARPWRVCNLPGALNATVARAMLQMTAPSSRDRFVNLTCGSGTLMIERLALGPARFVLGGDRDPAALKCARQNLAAAQAERRAALVRWDASRLSLPDASVNVLCSDLPYGMLMGSRRENERLYPALVAEATRVAVPGAVMVLITHAVSVLEQALIPYRALWTEERRLTVRIPYQSGSLKPMIFRLRRTGQR